MIWVGWRQHRAALIGGGAVLAALIAFLVISGRELRSTFERLGLDRCNAPIADACPEAVSQFERATTGGTRLVVPLVLAVPALVGIFWGAPLIARELEQGTHRFAWTQSVTRRRWFFTKVGLLVAATVVGSLLLTLALNWWAAPLNDARPQQFEAGMFDLLGLAPLGYGVLALALGVAAGTFTRRLVPALAITLVLFLGVRVGTVMVLRPHYMAPVHTTVAFPGGEGSDGGRLQTPALPSDIGWGIAIRTISSQGQVMSDGVGLDYDAVITACPEAATAPANPALAEAATAACVRRLGLYVDAVYQPADRFWRFQATEAGLNLAFAAACLGASVWWLQRRRA